eukprot:3699393-Lingulodinium_polyedra.AAC.1
MQITPCPKGGSKLLAGGRPARGLHLHGRRCDRGPRPRLTPRGVPRTGRPDKQRLAGATTTT